MLEEMISDLKSQHSKKPISKSQFDRWRASSVTRRLFEELELCIAESFIDYLAENSTDEIAITAMLRQGATQMVDMILGWTPQGIYVEDEL